MRRCETERKRVGSDERRQQESERHSCVCKCVRTCEYSYVFQKEGLLKHVCMCEMISASPSDSNRSARYEMEEEEEEEEMETDEEESL